MGKFSLIFVCDEEELFTPLVASQVFEQANIQAQNLDHQESLEVHVLIPLSLRNYFKSNYQSYKAQLNERFKNIKIHFVPGVSRLNHFPRQIFLYLFRKSLSGSFAIWHFRGDSLIPQFKFLKNGFPEDKFVADVRGIWPAEKLLLSGIEVMEVSEMYNHALSVELLKKLKFNLGMADGVCTVSPNLADFLKNHIQVQKPVWVVPCATKLKEESLDFFNQSENQFSKLKEKFVIGYLGGTASYQNLDDIVLPFMQALLELDSRVHLLFVTHQVAEMEKKITEFNFDSSRFDILTAPQKQVINYSKMMDLGLLLRKPNVVNLMAQPVKLGEYLSASVPVVVSNGLGGVQVESDSIINIDLIGGDFFEEAKRCLTYLQSTNRLDRKIKALETARDYFSWETNVKIHFKNYLKIGLCAE
ncbi:hypothetical protein [Mongoliitalea lutea]|uniref:Uncharacterized protein n=1 Tax=Mongoliitalea lutea TaxID=849756 RepID=A0A8J3G4P3_9BACT|nr:hypothetical protein [Mongoliitalea lutea]GHB31412.1 hypothetical protein GCM10008106_10200 [Mongoliitalea lutea]